MAANLNQPGQNNQLQVGPKKPQGSGFTNVQRYLGANTGVGQKVGSAVTQNVQNVANKANENVQKTQQNFNQALTPDEQRYSQSQQNVQSAFSDPTKFAQNQQNVDEFGKLRQGQVGYDPNKLTQQVQGLQTQGGVADLKNVANLANTQQGRFQLLQRTIGRPNYTQGQQKLDQLFLNAPQESGGLRKQITSATNPVLSNLESAQENLGQRLQGIERQRAETQSNIGQQLGNEQDKTGALGGFVSDVEGRATAENKTRSDLQDTAKKYLTGQIGLDQVPDELKQVLGNTKRFGGDSAVAQGILDKYLTSGMQANKGNITNQADLAKYQALNKLAGTQGTYLSPEDQANAQALDQRVKFDPTGFNQSRQQAYSAELTPLIQKYAGMWDDINKKRYTSGGTRMIDSDVDRLLKQSYESAIPQFQEISKRYGVDPSQIGYGKWSELASKIRAAGGRDTGVQDFYSQA